MSVEDVNVTETDLANYYGQVEFVSENGKYFMQLENWSGMGKLEISKEFYEAAYREFGNE